MPTVDRVLPWRREQVLTATELEPLVARFQGRDKRDKARYITRAYQMAAEAHEGQRRKSGEAYIHHPVAVARVVAELGLDEVTIAAALLHDSVEDTGITLDDLTREFDDDLAAIVDGVTKLDRIKFDTKEAQQAGTMRKMLVAMAKDIRVLIIKLADRLHNLRTIAGMPEWKQARAAQETLDVYAPLAHRLGMQEMKTQLEDLSFAALHPKRYSEIDLMVSTRAPDRELYLTQVLEEVRTRMDETRVNAEVTGREKHYWSIYEKMVVKGRSFEDMYDLVGIRVVVDSVRDCYAALGAIHATWKPVQGRFKDYVAMPKFNLYQSLHTTVVGPQGKPLEIQIRTREMHNRAEHGVAAHYSYKDETNGQKGQKGQRNGGPRTTKPNGELPWLTQMVDWQSEVSDPSEFMANLKVDLEQDEVFVFTPQGDILTLPAEATPVDFAYSIHTEVGQACVGARVNGRLVPLTATLQSGDSVEVITSSAQGAGPSRDWLEFVATPKARNKIRQWFSRERRDDAIATGHDDLIRAMRRRGLPVSRIGNQLLGEIAEELNYTDIESLHQAVGEHHVSAQSVTGRIEKALSDVSPDSEDNLPTTARRPRKRRTDPERPSVGVHVEGLDDVLIRLAKCCTPVPGDEIMGFVTRGRGVSVHRDDCANAVSLATAQGQRLVEVEWDSDLSGQFVASIEVKALDRAGLLMDISQSLSDHGVNILACSTRTGSDRIARLDFELELGDPSQADSVVRVVRRIDSVYDAYRVLPGQ
ncbi:MAG: bifunctional (p)ppGpp synthetase/guanosine-3',5'-bis(diphosphate) 3'-pyrophosphohydrolase [Actinomycetia bacterium]|nr:bifunctional (p)ppGpp synthetase/guanosine-3',5'-bis(diphosphate) 3'-pyrophosphohydrolase [Actinomycetes bacterium]